MWWCKLCVGLLCGLVAAATQIPLQFAVQSALSQYAEHVDDILTTAGFSSTYTIFDNDAYMVGNISSYNLSVSGGPLFQCMQLATHATKAMNLIVSYDQDSGRPLQYSSGAILALANRRDITNITSLKGKTIAAGQPTQLSSFLSQWFAIKRAGLNLFADIKRIIIVYNNSALLPMLQAGAVDAIFLSAVTAHATGDDVRILDPQPTDDFFPFLHTGDLYAGPLVCAIGNLNFELRKQISIALLQSPPSSNISLYGFSTPGDYSTARNLMSDLGVINENFTCNFATNITGLISCPSGYFKNPSPICQETCTQNYTCICNACLKKKAPVSKVVILTISFSVAFCVVLVASVVFVWLFIKKRKQKEMLDALTLQACDVFGFEASIKVVDWIGSGASADVYRGFYYNNEVAFKVSRISSGDGGLSAFEGEIMTKLIHPNIISTLKYGAGMQSNRTYWVITEYCNLGSLRVAVENKMFARDFRRTINLLKQLISGVQHIHDMGLVHGDLNCNNVLLTKAPGDPSHIIVKVADFGHARYVGSHTRTIGTISHMAPEIFTTGTRSPAQDIYAIGVMIWELTHDRIYTINSEDIYSVVHSDARPLITCNVSTGLKSIMQRCWLKNEFERPTIFELGSLVAAVRDSGFTTVGD